MLHWLANVSYFHSLSFTTRPSQVIYELCAVSISVSHFLCFMCHSSVFIHCFRHIGSSHSIPVQRCHWLCVWLQKAVQERDNQIKMLSEQVEQYTTEMEKNALLVEELKKPLKKEKGHVSVQQRRLEDLSSKLLVAERRALEAERAAQLAERDARDKDKELNDTLSRIRLYESVSLGTYLQYCKIHCRYKVKILFGVSINSLRFGWQLVTLFSNSIFNSIRSQSILTRSFSWIYK